ncbi:MAG: flagellar assembly protein FliH [Rubrivivax sp.]
MSSSSDRGRLRNVPPPPGSKAGTAYTRFIPREELQGFAAWNPDAFGGAAPSPAAEPEPREPTPAEWQAQVAAARQAGYQDGYRDGLAALENFKQSFAAQATAQVGRLIESLDAEFAALEARIAQAVAETAVTLARQVLRSELQARPELVTGVAAEAVNAVLLSARQIVLQVHPDDLPLVAEGAGELLRARGARLVADATIERGGCRVESDLGAVDARIATRWQQAASALGSQERWSE